jgi:hypothetical protein
MNPNRQFCAQRWSRAKQSLDVPIGGIVRVGRHER